MDEYLAPAAANDWTQTLQRVLAEEISQLYSAETLLAKALPKMLEAARDGGLKFICQVLEIQTGEHILRLNQIINLAQLPYTETTSLAIEGLLIGIAETIEENSPGQARDLSLIDAALKISHYQVTSYCCARDFATLLEFDNVMLSLQKTIDDETGMEASLANLAEFIYSTAITEALK